MKVTLSVIKADVGSIGGHTKPSRRMLKMAQNTISLGLEQHDIFDGMVTHTGDDIAYIMSHGNGVGSEVIHKKLAWNGFMDITNVAKKSGMYGAGQDLLKDAPS